MRNAAYDLAYLTKTIQKQIVKCNVWCQRFEITINTTLAKQFIKRASKRHALVIRT